MQDSIKLLRKRKIYVILIPLAVLFIAISIVLPYLPTKFLSHGQLATPSSTTGTTQFLVTLCPHGLGNCGDNTKPGYLGNISPKHATKQITLLFMGASSSPIATVSGTVTYSLTTQNFQGTLTSSSLSSGQYIVIIRMQGYLGKQLPGIISVAQGQSILLPPVSLVASDISIDNQLNILDYQDLISCFGEKASTSACLAPITTQNSGSDINDDGIVDGRDYNLFIRELSIQNGSGGGPTITPQPITVKHWIIGESAVQDLANVSLGSQFAHSLNTPATYEIMNKTQKYADPLPNAMHVLGFKSYQNMQAAFANNAIPSNIKVILYDNEHWPDTPLIEQQQPFMYASLSAQLVHSHNLLFMNTPATDLDQVLDPAASDQYIAYLETKLATLSQYADIFEIQAQNAPTVSEYISFSQQAMAQARAANNKAIILLGITAKTKGPTSDELIQEIQGTNDSTDGYWFNIIGGASGVTIALPVIQTLFTF